MDKKYYKEVEVSDFGMVIARVFKSDGRRVGLEFFSNSWKFGENAIKDKCKRAHKWCDERIKTCVEHEE